MKHWMPGDRVVRRRHVGSHEVSLFSGLIGDQNPIHFSDIAAQQAGFPSAIAHGMIAGSFFSEILGNELPGPGSIYLEQSFQFLAPVLIPCDLDISVEIESIRSDRKIYTVRTTCSREDGVICIDGKAVLLVRGVSSDAK